MNRLFPVFGPLKFPDGSAYIAVGNFYGKSRNQTTYKSEKRLWRKKRIP